MSPATLSRRLCCLPVPENGDNSKHLHECADENSLSIESTNLQFSCPNKV